MRPDRVLTTILFTDVVGSTEVATMSVTERARPGGAPSRGRPPPAELGARGSEVEPGRMLVEHGAKPHRRGRASNSRNVASTSSRCIPPGGACSAYWADTAVQSELDTEAQKERDGHRVPA